LNLNKKSWAFSGLGIGLVLVSVAMVQTIRFFLFRQPASSLNAITLICAGLMLALGGMIILLRLDRQRVDQSSGSEDKDSRFKLIGCHLSALSVWIGLPLGNLIFPYLIWAFGRHDSARLNREGLECLNFQLSLTLYILLSALMFYLYIGFLMLSGLFLLHLVSALYAAYRSWQGKAVRYPLTIQIIKPINAN
jgi:uncharacterized protein